MTRPETQIPANPSRLVRSLAELVGAETAMPHKHFTERLGQLFDLPDSIRISAVHARKPPATFEPSEISGRAVKEEFLRVRASIIASAIGRFTQGGGSLRLRFPVVTAQMTVDEAMAAEPYLAFYAAQQREVDFRIRNLQVTIRDSLAGISPALARLAALDAALGEPIAVHSRHFFAAVPQILAERFGILRDEYRRALPDDRHHDPDQWNDTLRRFRDDMRMSLLAEIDTRLLPVLGLIEALDEHEGP